MIFRDVTSMVKVGDSLIVTLECKHSIRVSTDYFKYKWSKLPRNPKTEAVMLRCKQCEQEGKGGAA